MKRIFSERNIGGADIFAALCAAFTASSLFFVLSGDFSDLTYVRQTSVLIPAVILILTFAAVMALSVIFRTKKIIAWGLLCLTAAFSFVLVYQNPGDIFFNLGIAAILILAAKYVTDSDKLGLSGLKMTPKIARGITVEMYVIYVAVIFLCTAAKYASYSHATYDFGIFSQMFEQMAKTGLPNTTVERQGLVSHFAVHFSPVFYLMLPGYYLFRSPLYLLLVQAAVTGAGVFPVRRICRTLGLSEKMSLAMGAAYLLFPTMSNGTFYDFHENKFLSVFILYMVWFILENNFIGTAVFALLTLSVKEDAFIYVLAAAVWMLFAEKGKRTKIFASLIAVFSVVWFAGSCEIIKLCGGEIMDGRFSNLSAGDNGGLLDAVKTCFLDVGYLIKEVFSGADTQAYREMTYSGQKLEFVLWTGAPLLFLPFAGKKKINLILLIPLVIINLASDWMYQYDVDFQYTYGTAALMIFAALLCISELPREKMKFIGVSVLLICTLFTVSLTLPKAEKYVVKYTFNKEEYKLTDEALEKIPDDASVTAYGFLMPHLSRIDDLHTCPVYYGSYEKTDYCVIDKRYEKDEHTKRLYAAMGEDYELCDERGFAKIYKLKTAG